MKFLFMVFLLVAAAFANSHNNSPKSRNEGSENWKPNHVYRYRVAMRTMTSLGNQNGEASASQWAGVDMEAHLTLQAQSEGRLSGRLSRATYAHVHHELSGGPQGQLPEGCKRQQYPGIEQPFEVRMKHGLVKELLVSKDMNMQDENMLKGLLGALQYDTSSKNVQDKKNSYLNNEHSNGVYKKMEREVTGDCQTLYTISELPLDVLQQSPDLAPSVDLGKLAQNNQNQRLIDIRKTRNYAECEKRVSYNFGVPQGANWENTAHSSKNFMSRSTTYRIIADRDNQTIYSTFGVDKIYASPLMYSNDRGMVVASLNMTLESVERQSGQPKETTSLRSAGSLIYSVGSKKQRSEFKEESEKRNQHDGQRHHENNRDYDYEEEKRETRGGRSRRSPLSEKRTEHGNKITKTHDSEESREFNYKTGSGSGWENSKSGANHRSQDSGSNYRSGFGDSSSSGSGSRSQSTSNDDAWIDEPKMGSAPSTLINNEQFRIHSKKSPVEQTVQIMIEIAEEMQNPNQMPHADTLSKINSLVNWISLMDSEKLEQANKKIESAASSKGEHIRKSAEKMYLEAVTQSGTPASYTYIKSLILKNQIHGQTAAQAVSGLSKALRYPTERLVKDFLNLAFEKSVRKQSGLNSTILLSVTNLINMGFVDEGTMHNYYPSHYAGKPKPETRRAVVKEALSVLENELQRAIQNRDDHKTQVLIAAIGNLGHPEILRVFAPYLERKVRTTKFLRQQIVKSMRQLAKVHPMEARYTLFNIYKNEGEDYEVRVAAIFLLMRSQPSSAMLKQMAEDSHTDSSKHVRSAIKSAITYVAGLGEKEQKFEKISRRAKEAKRMLTSEEYGFQYSTKYLDYYFSSENNAGLFQALELIGSEDSILHKSFVYEAKSNLGGWMKPKRVQGSISSIGKLIELIQNQVNEAQQGSGSTGNSGSKLSAENIAKIMNIKGDSEEALQASLFVKLLNEERLFAVGQDTFENLAHSYQQASQRLREGLSFNHTKFFNRENVEITVPTITGMMYFHKFKNPVYIQMDGRVQAKINAQSGKAFAMPESVNATGHIDLVYASDLEGKVGFYCPFDDKYMTSNVISKFQVYTPVKFNTDIDLVNGGVKVEVSPLSDKQDIEILHQSQNRFTAIRDRESTVVASQHKETKFIRSQRPAHSRQQVFGQESVGMAFHVESESDSWNHESNDQSSPRNLVPKMFQFWAEKQHRHSRLSVKYQPRQSQNNRIVMNVNYDNNKKQNQNQQNTQAWGSATEVAKSIPSDLTVGSRHRQEQLLQKVASGIQNARASSLDIGVEFLGQKKAEYVATLAAASSPVDQKVQAIFYFGKTSANGKQFQIDAVFAGKMPKSPVLNFKKALEFNTHADFDIQVNYGQQAKSGAQINIQGQMSKTQQRKDYLRQTPMAKLCENQMSQGNNLMAACHNVTLRATIMDDMKMTIQYQNIDQETKSAINAIYSAARHYVSQHIEEDWFNKEGKPNKIEVEARMTPDMERLNMQVNAPQVKILLKNAQVNKEHVRGLLTMNPFAPYYSNLVRRAYGNQSPPTCSIDGSKISTFTNNTYNYSIKNCWHVAMQNGSRQTQHGMENSRKQTTVLVREINGQKEVRILYRSLNGEEIQADLNHDGSIVVNGKQLQLAQDRTADVWNKKGDAKLISASHNGNELFVVIDEGTLSIAREGNHVVLVGSQSHRNRTRGLCGTMSSEHKYDLTTPENCYIRSKSLYGATWAMDQGQQCEQQVKQLAQEARRMPCIHRQEQSPSIEVSQHQRQCSQGESCRLPVMKSKNWINHRGCKLDQVTQVFQHNGQICITLRQLPACSEGCRQQESSQMESEVVCKSAQNAEFIRMKNAIENGEKVHLNKSKHQPNEHVVYMVPKYCQA